MRWPGQLAIARGCTPADRCLYKKDGQTRRIGRVEQAEAENKGKTKGAVARGVARSPAANRQATGRRQVSGVPARDIGADVCTECAERSLFSDDMGSAISAGWVHRDPAYRTFDGLRLGAVSCDFLYRRVC